MGIIDPPLAYRKLDAQELKKQDNWNVVVLSRVPILVNGKVRSGVAQGPVKHGLMDSGLSEKDYSGVKFHNCIWRFGKIRSDEVRSYCYRFTNTNRHKVVVSRVLTKCPCVQVRRYSEVVEPRGEGEIEIQLDPNGLIGSINKTVLCLLGDEQGSAKEQVELSVVGDISRDGELLITPPLLAFPSIVRGSACRRQITVRRIGFEPLSFKECRSTCPYVSVKNVSTVNEYEARIDIEYNADENEPIGPFEHKVTVDTYNSEYRSKDVVISGRVVEQVDATPKEVFFGLLGPVDDVHQSVRVEHRQGKPFAVTKCYSDNALIDVSAAPANDSGDKWVLAIANRGKLPEGVIEGDISVETDIKGASLVSVHCIGLVVRQQASMPRGN